MENNRDYDPFGQVAFAELALVAARDKVRAAAERSGHTTACLFIDSQFVPRAQADAWVDNSYANGRALGAKETLDAALGMLASRGKAPDPDYAHLAKMPTAAEMDTPEWRAKAETWNAAAELMDSTALAKFPIEKRAKICLAWSRENGAPEERKMDHVDNPLALQIVNANRKAHGMKALTRLESDEGDDTKSPKPKDLPGDYQDTSSDDDMEIGPDGKLRRRKPVAGDDDPQDHEEAPKPSAASQQFAFAVCNADNKRRGKKALSWADFIALR
jgi:hypothetical protein